MAWAKHIKYADILLKTRHLGEQGIRMSHVLDTIMSAKRDTLVTECRPKKRRQREMKQETMTKIKPATQTPGSGFNAQRRPVETEA